MNNHFSYLALRLSLLLCLIIGFNTSAIGQSYEYKINKITNEKGFDPGATSSIVEDSLGFIWFGTVDGLYRYDGFNYTVFRKEEGNENSLGGNTIRAMCMSRDNKIWIGIQGAGLDCFDVATQKFTHYINSEGGGNCISGNDVWSVFEDSRGDIWAGAVDNGVDRLNVKTQQYTHYKVLPENSLAMDKITIRSIYEDDKGIMWVGLVRYGISSINLKTGTVKNYIVDKGDEKSIYYNEVRDITQDSKGKIVIACYGAGIFRYDQERDCFAKDAGFSPNSHYNFDTNLISTVVEIHPNVFVFGTESGLRVLDENDSTLTSFLHDKTMQNSIGDNRIRTVFKDHNGIFWVGSEAGVDKIIEQRNFKIYHSTSNNTNKFPDGVVRSILEDDEQNLWVGIINKGLIKYNQRSKVFTNFLPNPSDRHAISGLHITSIFQDSQGDIWIGEWDSGLNIYNKTTGTFELVAGIRKGLTQISDTRIQFIKEESPGVLWIGTEHGLNKLDVKNKKNIQYLHSENDSNTLGGNSLQTNAIERDEKGNLWLGAWSGGLTKMVFLDKNREQAQFIHWKQEPAVKGKLNNNNIISLHLSPKGILWIGTFGGGLTRFDTESGEFKCYTTDHGLPNNVIFGIIEANDHTLWLSTDRGLSNFNPVDETFRNYTKADGLQDDHFYWGAALKSPSGEIFFGGINGLNSFDPSKIARNSHAPVPVLTDFKINEKTRLFGKPLWKVQELELPYYFNYLTFEFAALDYTEPSRNLYLYKMDGVDLDWHQTTQRVETYSNLTPGDYVFRMKGANSDGFWSKEEVAMKIHIAPPWNKTWWALSLFLILIIGGILTIYFLRIGILESQKHKLEEQVALRTQEIVEQKEVLETTNESLNNKNEALFTTLLELKETQQKLVESEKMASLGVLTAGVAHEINNPLNFIQAGITGIEIFYEQNEECVLSPAAQEEIHTLIDCIKTGVERVSGIVTSLNHFSRQANTLDQQCDIHKIVDNCLLILNNQIKYKVEIIKNYSLDNCLVTGNEGKLHQLFLNIIANSIHALSEKGEIVITTRLRSSSVEISIKDTGSGISEENLKKIFDPFFTTKEVGQGTGLGLSIVYGIVKEHKGIINYKSELGKGTEALIRLPRRIQA